VTKAPKRPRDSNQLAKFIVDIATGQADDAESEFTDAQKFAREGGLKSGRAGADSLTPERRAEIAKGCEALGEGRHRKRSG